MGIIRRIFGKKEAPASSGSLTTYNPSTGTATTYGAGGTVQSSSVSAGAMAIGSAGGGVNIPTATTSPTTNVRTGGSGGGSGGGSSYIDPTTGKGYEVSPEGIKKEVKVDRGSTYNSRKSQGFTRASSREDMLESNKRANIMDNTRQAQERYNQDTAQFEQSRRDYYKNLIAEKKIYAPTAEKKYREEVEGYNKDYATAINEDLNRSIQGIVVKGDTKGSSGDSTQLYFGASGVISAAPTYKEMVKSESQRQGSVLLGFLGGTSQYIQGKVTTQRYISANKGNSGTYQPEATGRVAGLFFDMNPVSGVLYGLGSVEQLVRKKGRESLSNQYESNIIEGNKPLVAATKSYAPALVGAGLTFIGVGKAGKYLGEVKSTKSIQSSINKLSNAPIEDVAVVWRGTGEEASKVQVQAIQRAGDFERRIVMSGKLVEGEEGVSFIQEGAGRYVGGGTIKKNNIFGKDYKYLEGGTFRFGGAGKVKPLFNIGDVQVGTSYTTTFTLPETSTYSIRTAPSFLRKSKAFSSEVIKGGTPEIDIRGGVRPSVINDELVLTGENFVFSKGSVSYEQSTLGRGVTIEVNKPIIEEDIGKIYGGSKKTPFSTTFGEQTTMQETKTFIPSITRGVKTPKVILQKPTLEGTNIPYMVGGLGLKEVPAPTKNIIFEDISRTSLDMTNNNVMLPIKENTLTTNIISVGIKSTERLKPLTLNITPQKETSKSKQIIRSIVKPVEIVREEQKYIPKAKQILRQLEIIKQNERYNQKYIVKPKMDIKVVPIIVVPKIKTSNKILDRVKSGESNLFEAFAFKNEKPFSLGKASTQEEAESLLKGTLRKTLRAGGFLTKGGAKIKASELQSFGGGEFRLSKVSKYNIVEQKPLRLRKSGTGKQIQEFRF